MDISLEKIELVKDRTGVSYKEAKEVLEKCDGNVVDSIIEIEDNMEEMSNCKFVNASNIVVDKVKTTLEKGNVIRIKVKKEDEIILNLPMIAGVVGFVIAPVASAIGTIAALGFRYKVEIEKEDGEIIHIDQMAEDTFNVVKEKGIEAAGIAKDMGTDAYNNAKDYASEAINKAMGKDKVEEEAPLDSDEENKED